MHVLLQAHGAMRSSSTVIVVLTGVNLLKPISQCSDIRVTKGYFRMTLIIYCIVENFGEWAKQQIGEKNFGQ